MGAGADQWSYNLGEVAEIIVRTPEGEEVYSNGVEFLLTLDKYDDVLDIAYEDDVDVDGQDEFTIQVYDNEWQVSPEEIEEMAENYQDALDENASLKEDIEELEAELDSLADKHKKQKETMEKLKNEVEDYQNGLSRLGTVDEVYEEDGKLAYTPEGSSHSKIREMRDGFLARVDEGDRLLLDNKTLAIQGIFEKYNEVGSGYEVDDRDLPDVSFDDIGGLDEELDTLERKLVLQQEFPDVYGEDGVLESTGGVLLHGPPGTGKTMSVQALANEHDMDFYAIDGPEVMTKWVGQAEENIRRVAQSARESAPAIIMFDELDSIAQQRGSSSSNNVGERVVSQLLTMMEGMEDYDDVYWVASTNRLDLIDDALTRPGRFGTQIKFSEPNEEATQEIAEKYMPDEVAETVTETIASNEAYLENNSGALIREVKERAVEDYLLDVLDEGREAPEELEGDVSRDDLAVVADEGEYFEEAVEDVFEERLDELDDGGGRIGFQ